MRDPKRIDEICELLREYWHKNPDLRLGQIITNHYWMGTKMDEIGTNLFQTEDTYWKKWFEAFMEEYPQNIQDKNMYAQVELVRDLYEKSRGFTKEEAEAHSKMMERLSKPVSEKKSFYEILKETEEKK